MDAYRTLGGELDFKPGVGIKRADVTFTLVKVLTKSNPSLTLQAVQLRINYWPENLRMLIRSPQPYALT